MRHLLAAVHGSDDAQKRLTLLEKKYPDSKFEIDRHETRFQLFCTASPNLTQPRIDQMKRTASGGDPVTK